MNKISFLRQFNKSIFELVLLGIIYFGSYDICEAQYSRTKQSSRVTVYGDFSFFYAAGQASINIEGLILHKHKTYKNKTLLYGRIGYGTAIVMELGDGPGIIGGLTFLKGNRNNHFEINAAGFLAKPGSFEISVLPILDFGYRYQKPSGGFLFRAKAGIWGAGIGLGYAF